MLSGKIRSLNADKGFGFIQPAGGGPDLFFHCSSVDTEFTALSIDLPVEYEVDAKSDKPRAKKIVTGLAPRQSVAKQKPLARPSNRSPRREIVYAFGYITKLPRKNPIGFISATTGGPEHYFEPDFVKGKKFAQLKVGDYVRFIPKANPENPKEPLAKAVEVVPKPINKQENRLQRHPKARRKKPTWKS